MTATVEHTPTQDLDDVNSVRDILVRAVRMESEGVISLELADPEGRPLPEWTAGAHVDLVLPSGLVRQYSLCGEPGFTDHYRVAVLREEAGRGGSAEIHDTAIVGRTLKMRGPRNHFRLEDAPHHVFIAGGIGVTPILAMVRSLPPDATYEVVYGGRTRSSMAFIDELASVAGPRLTVVPQDEQGLIDLSAVLDRAESPTLVYCCGPGALLDAVRDACEQKPHIAALHIERFTSSGGPAVSDAPAEPTQGFEVELAQSGQVASVGPNDLLIDKVRELGVDVMSSCEEGFCGTCETKVLEGEPEHHDTILSDRERAEAKTMMICVGRSKSPRLVLDL